MKEVTIGVIGAGRIGKLHVGNASAMPGVHVKAVSDISPKAIEEFVGHIPLVTTDYDEVLADKEIDAVLICSSTNTHADIIEKAARAGKHVFCEKPVSFNLSDTQRAVQAARDAGVILQVGFNRRFDHNFMRIRTAVSDGVIGQPQIVKITSRDPEPPSPEYIAVSGGLFMDMAIHDFDLARFLVGAPVESVHVEASVLVDAKIGELGDVDTAVTTLKFEGGAICVIDNCRRAVYGYDQRVEVFGSKGCVMADNDFHTNVHFMTAENVHRDNPKYFFLDRYTQAYQNELASFLESVRSGAPVLVDGMDGVEAELIAHAAKLSWVEGRTVKIEEVRQIVESVG